MIMTGKDKGKTGEVLSVLPAKERLLVRGVNTVSYTHLTLPTNREV